MRFASAARGSRRRCSDLELALAAAAPGRLDEWARRVTAALEVLHEVWTRHIVETEAPGAFLDELVERSAPPRRHRRSRLRREHSEILDAITRRREAARGAARRLRRVRRRRCAPTSPRCCATSPATASAAPTSSTRPTTSTSAAAADRSSHGSLHSDVDHVELSRGPLTVRLRVPFLAGLVFVLVERFAAAEAGRDADDRRELAAGRGVRGEEAGDADEDRARTSSEPSGHGAAWRTPASTVWYQWNSASSASSAWPSAAISSARRRPRRKPYASLPASSTIALRVEARGERVEVAARRCRQPRRGHVEEAVEVDAQHGVHAAAQQLRGRVAAGAPGATRSRP